MVRVRARLGRPGLQPRTRSAVPTWIAILAALAAGYVLPSAQEGFIKRAVVGYFDFLETRNHATRSPSSMPATATMPEVKYTPAKRNECRHPYKNSQRKATTALTATTTSSQNVL